MTHRLGSPRVVVARHAHVCDAPVDKIGVSSTLPGRPRPDAKCRGASSTSGPKRKPTCPPRTLRAGARTIRVVHTILANVEASVPPCTRSRSSAIRPRRRPRGPALSQGAGNSCGVFARSMNHRNAGFKANAMGVWAVPDDRLDEIVPQLAGFAAVVATSTPATTTTTGLTRGSDVPRPFRAATAKRPSTRFRTERARTSTASLLGR